MKEVNVVGIDLAKDVFNIHGVNAVGAVVMRRKLRRGELKAYFSNVPASLIGMEACGGANYWARTFRAMGHRVGIMPPQFVKPYRKSGKNDYNDAEAICEAVSRPNMRFVSVKEVSQQDIQSLHRVRQRVIRNRTALVNEARGLLMEYGITIPRNISQFKKLIPAIIEDVSGELAESSRDLFRILQQELGEYEGLASCLDDKITALFKQNELCRRISQIEGIGPITATAILGSAPNPKDFKNGRQYAAFFGLVPRQNSSGGKTVLLGIHKRGDAYLRTLLVHGARAALRVMRNRNDSKSVWVTNLMNKRGHNKACVALANKNARQFWAVMAKGEDYRKAA